MSAHQQQIEKLRELADLLHHHTFETARLLEGRVLLQAGSLEETIEYAPATESRVNGLRIPLIRKDRDVLYFTLSSLTDDEWGLLYSPTCRVDLHRVERLERVRDYWFTFARS